MKAYIKNSLALSAVIITVIAIVTSLIYGYNPMNGFLWAVVLVGFAAMGIHYVTAYFFGTWSILEIAVKYILEVALVLVAGIFLNWFSITHWWMAFVYVSPVFLISSFLEIAKNQSDIQIINKTIKERKERENKGENGEK